MSDLASRQNLKLVFGSCICRLIYLGLLVCFTSSCTSEDTSPVLTDFQKDIIAYFDKVALGFEFGGASEITRKWVDDMRIFVGGEQNQELKNELEKIVAELNELATDGFEVKVVQDSITSNFYLFLGPGEDYADLYPSQSDKISGNFGLFSVFWDGNNNINRGHMYVDTHRAQGDAQKHLLREELTQSLGLARDAPDYQESIFQQDFTTTTSYATIDKYLIRLLYHPKMMSGLDEMKANDVLTEILLEE